MLEIVVALVTVFVPEHAARGLASTAPTYLSHATAREHLGAATLAASMTGTDLSTLLSIAWHESRYTHTEITVEPPDPRTGKPRWSCGVMTPEPLVDRDLCDRATASLVDGYLAGARHLQAWLRVCNGHQWCALRGYAGAATHDCAAAVPTSACIAARDFVQRARWIKASLVDTRHRQSRPAS